MPSFWDWWDSRAARTTANEVYKLMPRNARRIIIHIGMNGPSTMPDLSRATDIRPNRVNPTVKKLTQTQFLRKVSKKAYANKAGMMDVFDLDVNGLIIVLRLLYGVKIKSMYNLAARRLHLLGLNSRKNRQLAQKLISGDLTKEATAKWKEMWNGVSTHCSSQLPKTIHLLTLLEKVGETANNVPYEYCIEEIETFLADRQFFSTDQQRIEREELDNKLVHWTVQAAATGLNKFGPWDDIEPFFKILCSKEYRVSFGQWFKMQQNLKESNINRIGRYSKLQKSLASKHET